jgi:hypothetical protein
MKSLTPTNLLAMKNQMFATPSSMNELFHVTSTPEYPASIAAAQAVNCTLEVLAKINTPTTLTDLPPETQEEYTRWIQEWQYTTTPIPASANFRTHLIHLIAKADLNNRECLRCGFPEEVQAYEMFYKGEINV